MPRSAKLCSLLALLVLASGASSQQKQMEPPVPDATMAYRGAITPRAARIVADVRDTAAATSVSFELANVSDQQVQENVGFAESRALPPKTIRRLSIAPKSVEQFQEKRDYRVEGAKLKLLRIDPRIELGGKQFLVRYASVTIEIKLPPGVEQLVYSSLPNGKISTDASDGRKVVTYALADQYLLPVVLKWSSDTQLQVTKTVLHRANGLDITVTVKNVGPNPASDLLVRDTFHPGFVVSGSPAAEFRMERGAQNDQRLVWEHKLASLAPGETATLTYQVQFRGVPPHGLKFEATTVSRFADGELVGASAPVLVSK